MEALPLWVVIAIWLLSQRKARWDNSNYWKVRQHRRMLAYMASQVPYPGIDRISSWLYRKVMNWIHREITILDTEIVAGLINLDQSFDQTAPVDHPETVTIDPDAN
jgi:hypothetical protein